MEWIRQIWNEISNLFKWWVIILPWEKGLRIRLGKKTKTLNPGIHLRIPYIDSCYKQSTKLYFVSLSMQTLTNKTGQTITLSMNVGYSIKDIEKVYNSVGELQTAISGNVQGMVAKIIHDSNECSPSIIEEQCKTALTSKDWGIEINEIKVISFALVKTFRLIQDSSWTANNHPLETKI